MRTYLAWLRAPSAFVPEGDARAGAAPWLVLPLSLSGGGGGGSGGGGGPGPSFDEDATVASHFSGAELPLLVAAYFAGFALLFAAAPRLLRLCFGPGFARLDARSRETARSYLFALAHHGVSCAVALPALWLDASAGVVVPSRMAAVAPLSAAYLLADISLVVLPDALRGGGLGYLPHHLLGLGVTLAALRAPLRLLRFAAHFSVCEISNFALAALYACEKGRVPAAAPLHVALQLLFLALFALTRFVNLPLAVAALCFAHERDWDSAGALGQLSSVAIILLQLYWMGKILAKLQRNLGEALGWQPPPARRAVVAEGEGKGEGDGKGKDALDEATGAATGAGARPDGASARGRRASSAGRR